MFTNDLGKLIVVHVEGQLHFLINISERPVVYDASRVCFSAHVSIHNSQLGDRVVLGLAISLSHGMKLITLADVEHESLLRKVPSNLPDSGILFQHSAPPLFILELLNIYSFGAATTSQ